MKKIERIIEIRNVYDYEELMEKAPFFKDIYSVVVGRYGYLHDVGTLITFVRDGKGEGWNTLKNDFNNIVKECKDCWEIVNDFGYH